MTRRRDPNSWMVVRLPERDLAELILELAAPLLDRLGPTRTIEDARGALDLAVMFWNASVLASKHWPHPRAKDLNELRHRMRGRQARCMPDRANHHHARRSINAVVDVGPGRTHQQAPNVWRCPRMTIAGTQRG